MLAKFSTKKNKSGVLEEKADWPVGQRTVRTGKTR